MSLLKGGDIFNMASKGQKFKKYTKKQKEEVLKETDITVKNSGNLIKYWINFIFDTIPSAPFTGIV